MCRTRVRFCRAARQIKHPPRGISGACLPVFARYEPPGFRRATRGCDVEEVLLKSLAAASAAGIIGAIVWAVKRLTGIKPDERRPSLNMAEMIAGLHAIIEDADASEKDRRRAQARLDRLEPRPPGTSTPVARRRISVRGLNQGWTVKTGLVIGWFGFSWMRYELATSRIDECHLMRGVQSNLCFLHAIEARDSAIIFGVGAPLGLIAAAVIFNWVVRVTVHSNQTKMSPGRTTFD